MRASTNMNSSANELYLINPPFSMPGQPVISIPALVAYLRQRQIDVAAFDLNLAFFQRLLLPDNILRGYAFVQQRFLALNQQPQLNFTEMTEYRKLCDLLLAAKRWAGKINLLQTGLVDFSDIRQEPEPVKILYIQFAAASWYPECSLVTRDPIFATTSTLNPFSSSDISASTQREMPYSRILDDLLRAWLPESPPKIIGISVSYYNQILPAFSCARLLKKLMPQTHITMGGAGIFIYFRHLKEPHIFEYVDSLILDDGEIPLERLVHEVSRGQNALKNVPGLMYVSEGRIVCNDPPPVLDFTALPAPDYTIFPLDEYFHHKRDIRLPVRLSKGCSWGRCSFCRTRLSTINAHQQPSFEEMYRILKQTVHDTGIRKIHIADESISPEALEYLSRRIMDERLDIDWDLQTRFHESLNRQRCLLFKAAGCSRIYLGAESLNDRLLLLMKKGITARLIEDTLAQLRGIVPITLFMIVGFPTETEEEALHSFQHVRAYLQDALIDSYRYSMFAIYSGSEIAENPDQFGIRGIHGNPACDLSPDVSDFESHGMSRETMRKLYLMFSTEVPGATHAAPSSFTLHGQNIKINYDLNLISDMMRNQVINAPIAPFSSWLTSNTEVVLPWKK